VEHVQKEAAEQGRQRESPRLREKGSKNKPIIKRAQELVSRKCDLVKESQELDSMTLQNYLVMYKKPLIEDSTEAIKKLAEIVEEKTKKKKKKDKKKGDNMEATMRGKMGRKSASAGVKEA
jgi:hypothetical protein